MHALFDALNDLDSFMNSGGPVLYLIAFVTFLMWTLIFERLWYYAFSLRVDVSDAMAIWEARTERKSWNAKQIRRLLVSGVTEAVGQNLSLIKTLVALCPLLGLLGTVTGMIEVFNVMAVTGGGEAKAMAGGVSKATIPTMAGMVAALSGLFAETHLSRVAERENTLLEDHLTTDH
jgi:biopolymer transport protein ExbB